MPVALGLIFVMLHFGLKSLRDVLIVATGVPLGAVGGVLALWLRDMPFTVSAAVGFVALSGVAILNGLVLVTFIKQQLAAGATLEKAVRDGCLARRRPVLMTAMVAAAGFVPMAIMVRGKRVRAVESGEATRPQHNSNGCGTGRQGACNGCGMEREIELQRTKTLSPRDSHGCSRFSAGCPEVRGKTLAQVA